MTDKRRVWHTLAEARTQLALLGLLPEETPYLEEEGSGDEELPEQDR